VIILLKVVLLAIVRMKKKKKKNYLESSIQDKPSLFDFLMGQASEVFSGRQSENADGRKLLLVI